MDISVITLLFVSFVFALVLVLLGLTVILGVEVFYDRQLENAEEYSTETPSNEENENIESDEKQLGHFELEDINAI